MKFRKAILFILREGFTYIWLYVVATLLLLLNLLPYFLPTLLLATKLIKSSKLRFKARLSGNSILKIRLLIFLGYSKRQRMVSFLSRIEKWEEWVLGVTF